MCFNLTLYVWGTCVQVDPPIAPGHHARRMALQTDGRDRHRGFKGFRTNNLLLVPNVFLTFQKLDKI